MDELIKLMSTTDYISGEKLCQSLGLTRGAVWKRIEKLRQDGYQIESAGKRGYMLALTPDSLLPALVQKELRTRWAGQGEIYYQQEIGSTNAWCKEKAREGARQGTLCLCERQTAGRGRLGRVWDAQLGENLLMTLLLRPTLPPHQAQVLTLAAALATAKAIEETTGLEPKIKWPNDLLLGGKKLVGILLEMSADMDRLNYVVMGIGVNVNQTAFSGDLSDTATSLRLAGGKAVDRRQLLISLLKHIENTVDAVETQGFAGIADEYGRRCPSIHQHLMIKPVNGEAPYEADGFGVDETGALLLKMNHGEIRRVISAEVSIRGEI